MLRSYIDLRNSISSTLYLYNASLNGELKQMEWLIGNQAADPNGNIGPNGWTPLHAAASEGHNDAVELLLNTYKAAVNALDNDGNTPLHVAAHNGYRATVSILLKYGASLNIKNADYLTPYSCIEDYTISENLKALLNPHGLNEDLNSKLFSAAYNGNIKFMESLFLNGANCQFIDPEDGWTALHVAASEGHTQAVSLLLKHGALIDAQDKNGNTALHFAAHNDYSETVGKLIEYGALDIKNKNNQTPYEFIEESRIRENMAKLLNTRKFFIITEKQSFPKLMSFWKLPELGTVTSAKNQAEHSSEKSQYFSNAFKVWKEHEAEAPWLSLWKKSVISTQSRDNNQTKSPNEKSQNFSNILNEWKNRDAQTQKSEDHQLNRFKKN